LTLPNPERFERPYEEWNDAEKQEFLTAMNHRVARPLTLEQVETFEYWNEWDMTRLGEPLSKTQQFQLLGYLTDKLLRTRGRLALLKVQGRLAKEQGKRLAGAFKHQPKPDDSVTFNDPDAEQVVT